MGGVTPAPAPPGAGPLRVAAGDLARCVSCGLCLPHCPTFRVTGDEAASPRGRIAAMRAVQEGEARLDDGRLQQVIDSCVGCRGCETACPSQVPFGRMLEGTRRSLVEQAGALPWWRRLPYRVLGRHRLLIAGSRLAAVAQRLRLLPRRLGIPPLLVHDAPLVGHGSDVWLFTGCVMDAWFRSTHRSVISLARAAGIGVAVPAGSPCCGALALHAGLHDLATAQAAAVMAAFPGSVPIVVDSAGCGAALKEYGDLLGTAEARAFSARVSDVHEWLAGHLAALPHPPSPLPVTVAVHDPCHLRHAQRAHEHVRTVLAPFVERLVELDDEGLCCGAGGAYSVQQPDMAGAVRDRKVAAISRSGAAVVASANPGCLMHLRGAGLDVRHPVDLLVEALERH